MIRGLERRFLKNGRKVTRTQQPLFLSEQVPLLVQHKNWGSSIKYYFQKLILNLPKIQKTKSTFKTNNSIRSASLFVPIYLKKILKIFVNAYQLRYWVVMIQFFVYYKLTPRSRWFSSDVIEAMYVGAHLTREFSDHLLLKDAVSFVFCNCVNNVRKYICKMISSDVIEAMLVHIEQGNFLITFCFVHQQGRRVFCLLYLLRLSENDLLAIITQLCLKHRRDLSCPPPSPISRSNFL